jgi:hypothetical protein
LFPVCRIHRVMALRDVTNQEPKNYIPQVQLALKYTPLIRRGKNLNGQASLDSFLTRRVAGENHIDLWVDDGLYPIDPARNSPSIFATVKDYLEFLCEEESGMLGYTKRLKIDDSGTFSLSTVEALKKCVADLKSRVVIYENEIRVLTLRCQELQFQLELCSERCLKEREELCVALRDISIANMQERDNLQNVVRTLESTCSELRMQASALISSRYIEDEQHKEKVQTLEVEISKCKVDFEKLEQKMRTMVKTPLGFRQRVHEKIKSIDELSSGSGYAKRRRSMLRAQLQPNVVGSLQRSNREGSSKKRLMGDATTQNKTAIALGYILSKGEASALMSQPKMNDAKNHVVRDVFKKIGDSIGRELYWQHAMDPVYPNEDTKQYTER